MTVALLASTFLNACGTTSAFDRIGVSARTIAEAGQVDVALEAARTLPDLPEDCREEERSGVALGERLDAAALRTDHALTRANQRVRRCAGWYDDLRDGRAAGESDE